jgi:hypothetical protein
MSKIKQNSAPAQPPPLNRGPDGRIDQSSLADVIEWFIAHDPRVAVIRHPSVEEIFRWKQETDRRENPNLYTFNCAEDRLAIGIFQALAANSDERALYEWIGQLLEAIQDSARTNEELAAAYGLDAGAASALAEAKKLPARREQAIYLASCWLETLCTAEVRVLGWVYQALYGRAFHPDNF